MVRALVAACVLALLAGCGTGTVGGNTGAQNSGAQNSGGPITVETARGQVSLAKPATKVVVLEWAYTEELVSLGVTPVGNADNDGYKKWVTAPGSALPGGVADLGQRQEPSLERIKTLAPDLIVGEEKTIAVNYDQLKAIAPVVSFDYPVKPQFETMRKNYEQLAKAVGKQDKGKEVLARLDAKAAEVKSRIKPDTSYAFAQAYSVNGTPTIRMFTGDTLVVQVLGLTGLRSTWQGQPDSWGLSTVGVEGLTQVPAGAALLYVAQNDDNPFTGALAGNPVWQNLGFVKQKKLYPLDPGTWTFGGPLSAVQLLDGVGKALAP
ncbi:ABC transporter substrate-binding protein [Kibdelosporangium phytohabitans]|uniref:Fe3+-citrate ABC transporter substrate-binding protein n=1 Tax=Kibdelosporangium phytohabitans TaxID=860235 RepID=A0A0N9I8J2_9PSEU|nr:iron-siderophore ABC transporter substrate-binding protein [Kibdelosporangium phytohabitans]ALG10976.1 Fe3+-citrate ABC transporter substrate-binding protein [Kibdelosporangium phytohabitans]MBE1462187.1 iron complex transport system substrate-binding protein [Kibdelosporangium phytohabitans]